MRESGWGRIVAIGGLTARQAGSISAGARNAALVNLIRAMSRELGRDQITANVVHPALTVTETMEERLYQMAQRTGFPLAAMVDAAARDNPQGRLVTALEVADVVAFLCSPRSSAVNGEAIGVGGGSGSGVFY
jgi:NAD(P)-dependent dehydrogenase (short-subunit alcohol dehydrogenase family)